MVEQQTYIGVDVGGTKIFAVRADSAGRIEATYSGLTEADGGKQAVLENLYTAISRVSNEKVSAIGIAWAGFVDHENGVIVRSPNIKTFINVPLKRFVEEKYNKPVFIDNDARLFTLAEAKIGGEHENRNVLGIILGTGVGGGVVLDGKLARGHQGFAGEIGHQYVDLHNQIEAEEIFSASGMKEFFETHGLSTVLEDNVLHWQKKHVKGYAVMEDWISLFACWLTNLVIAYNPSRIVFGGGIGTHVLPAVIARIEERVLELLHERNYEIAVQLTCSNFENAGVLGAIFYAHQQLTNRHE